MSKNTRNTQFRRVDVDQYSEDKFEEDEHGDEAVINGVGPNEVEVQTLLSQGRNVDALKVALRNPPVTSKNQAVKDKSLQTVMRVLMSTKSADVDAAVKSLDSPTQDILMKYIYRGFEVPAEGSSAQLLTWHQKLFASAGLGCIVRVLTDRKRV